MSNAVFKIKYAKGTRSDKGGYLNYIATREDVALPQITETKKYRASNKQLKLIEELKELYPMILETKEFKMFEKNKSMFQASNVIDHCLDFSVVDENVIDGNYLKYIGERPRVVKTSTHGLWGSKDSYDLQNEVDKLNAYEGNVFNAIISLTREDATRLGYDNIDNYKNLIKKNIKEISEIFHIKYSNLEWYGAYHDESYHPHVHLVLYSKDPSEGYLSKYGIENFKRILTNDIFLQDNINVYKQKDKLQDDLKMISQEHIKTIISNINVENVDCDKITNSFNVLNKEMNKTNGKKVFAYLPKAQKEIVHDIVNELCKNNEIKELYNLWYEQSDILISHYHKTKKVERVPLIENKSFKTIKNLIVNIAKNYNLKDAMIYKINVDTSGVDQSIQNEISESVETSKIFSNRMEDIKGDFALEWSDEYKKAKNLLYGNKRLGIEKNEISAFSLMQEVSREGNVLALYDLAMMQEKGLGCEIDEAQAKENYLESLDGFETILSNSENTKTDYLNYRIGKFYNQGKGIEKNNTVSLNYLEKATDNKFALYTIGSIYKYGDGVDINLQRALKYFERSAHKKNPFGCYEVAKAYENGLGCSVDVEKSIPYYKSAYEGFERFLDDFEDDKIQYRLGQMTYFGIGCDVDKEKGVSYLKLAIENKNENAKYMLSKIYLESKNEKEVIQAIAWLKEMNDNNYANVLLGRIYLFGIPNKLAVNEKLGLEYLENALEANDDSAKLLYASYCIKNKKIKLLPRAIGHLNQMSDENNSFAQYWLGRFYLFGVAGFQDRNSELGNRFLSMSADNGNEYASQLLNYKARQGTTLLLLNSLAKIIGRNMISHNNKHGSSDHKQKNKEKMMRELLGLKD